MSDPRTAAGRALLAELCRYPHNEGAVCASHEAVAAIENEAIGTRLPECPACDDSWAAHVAGMHSEWGEG